MAKAKLSLVMLASTAWLPAAAEAQMLLEPAHGSVLFPPSVSTYYFNPGFADLDLFAPGGSGEGAFSFWWNSSTPPGYNSVTYAIAATAQPPNSLTLFSLSFYNTRNLSGIANGTRLRVYLGDGAGINCVMVSDTPLFNFNSTWVQPVTLKWNTNTVPNQINGTIGPTIITWNTRLQAGCNTAFKTPYPNAPWTIGAFAPVGTPTNFYHGMFAEFAGHFQDGDWADLSMRGSAARGTALRVTVKPHDANSNVVVPLDLGVNCQNVFGLPGNKLLPAICMRGDSTDFPVNHDGDSRFVVPMGFLPPTDGSSDPFELR